MIASLEAELGTKLFERERKSIRLNEHGKLFLRQVDIAQALEDGKRGCWMLSVSAVITLDVRVSSHLLPDLLADFRKEWPHAEFQCSMFRHSKACRASICAYPMAQHHQREQRRSACLKRRSWLPFPPSTRSRIGTMSACRSSRKRASLPCLRVNPRETTDAFCRLAGFTPHPIRERRPRHRPRSHSSGSGRRLPAGGDMGRVNRT